MSLTILLHVLLPLLPPRSLHGSVFLFLLFSIVVVHFCQRLVEYATVVIEPEARKACFVRAAICIGSLVWSLDVMGFSMYPSFSIQGARLPQAVLALLIMVASASLSIPALTNTRSRRRLILAALGLSLGMLTAHVLMVSAMGSLEGTVRWGPASLAMGLGLAMSSVLALLHRSAQLRTITSRFTPLSWPVKCAAGMAVLPLHLFLANSIPVTRIVRPDNGGEVSLLLALVLFGVMIAVELFSLEGEGRRQALLDQALALVRCMHPQPEGETAHHLALIAERLPALMTQLELHFQPICPLDPKGGVRFEALLRLEDPVLGRINPELFFLACERMGKTEMVDRTIITLALDRTMACRLKERPWAGLSVNTAPATLLAPDFIPWLQQLLQGRNLPSHWLLLEITEHTLIASVDKLRGVLERLRKLGVGVVMDDFGTGFSSLSVLASLPIHSIKCDRSFVQALGTDPARLAILRHVCGLGQCLSLPVTVEGVETAEELAAVRCCGATSVQGYFFAKAMPLEQTNLWLASHTVAQTEKQPAPLKLALAHEGD